MAENILEIKNLSKSFGTLKAVNELNLVVKPGEIFGLLGPNGAGKTTTIKMILGLLDKDDGEISVFGMNPERDEIEIKKNIGYVAEEPIIYRSLTPKELFNFVGSLRNLQGEEVSKRLANLLESFDAIKYYNKSIATLSRGNKQKIQIIAALLHEPKLLILDEPFSGLDTKSVKVFKEILKMHVKKGGSIIFSTHVMEIAENMCDRITIIKNGKNIATGTVEELKIQAKQSKFEDVFLELTEEEEEVKHIIDGLHASQNGSNGTLKI
jgi:ABC-2 type transport system ATP-binding protein